MRYLWLPVLLIALVVAPVPSRADFTAGLKAYDAGDFKTAMKEWLPLAQAGDAEAQFRVGRLYDVGEGVPRNAEKAISWYQKSAEQKNLNAAFNLGSIFYEGTLVKKNYAKAYKYWRLAAETGDPVSQSNLGLLLVSGKGIKRDFAEAYKWFFLASGAGNLKAKEAVDYFKKVVPESEIEAGRRRALEWRRR